MIQQQINISDFENELKMSVLLKSHLFLKSNNFLSNKILLSCPDFWTNVCYLNTNPKVRQRTQQKKTVKIKIDKPTSIKKKAPAERRINIDYHNSGSSNVLDLQFDSSPVLFIKKYKEVLDFQDLVFKVS